MYTYSKKSRRRMHAIPAAIALSALVMLWYFSDNRTAHAADAQSLPSSEKVLLSARLADDWSVDCDDCVVEPQYDVMLGNVVRLQSRSEMVLSLDIDDQVERPQLSWRWTVDEYVDQHPLLRLSVYVDDTDAWPERTLHYIWDSGREAGTTEAISDFEHLVVVNGKNSKAESWQQVRCNLNQDWQRIYNEDFPEIESLELALGMPGKLGVSGAFIEQLSIASAPFEEVVVAQTELPDEAVEHADDLPSASLSQELPTSLPPTAAGIE